MEISSDSDRENSDEKNSYSYIKLVNKYKKKQRKASKRSM